MPWSEVNPIFESLLVAGMRCRASQNLMAMYCLGIDDPVVFWPVAVCNHYKIPFRFVRQSGRISMRVMMKGLFYAHRHNPITKIHVNPLIASAAWCRLVINWKAPSLSSAWGLPRCTLSAAQDINVCCHLYGLKTTLSAARFEQHYIISCQKKDLIEYGNVIARAKGVYPPLTGMLSDFIKQRKYRE